MHKILTQNLHSGMIVGQGVYHVNGALLLQRGTRLTPDYIEHLKKLEIQSIYVTSSDLSIRIQPPPDIIQEKTRVQAIKTIFNTFNRLQSTSFLQTDALQKQVGTIIRDLIDTPKNTVQVSDIRLHDDYTFSHSVNVAVWSAMLGRLCKLPHWELNELTLGALLHDIGKTKISLSILNKPGRLNSKEKEVICMHSTYGYKILQQNGKFSTSVMHISLQHHERYDGTGYPQKLDKNNIHKYARIVAIADVYDALTCERPYKNPYKPNLAYKIMAQCNPGQFDPVLLKLFFDHVAIYPVGTFVKTPLGSAIVLQVIPGHTLQPVIRLFADASGNPIHTKMLIDLTKSNSIQIEGMIDDREISALIKRMNLDPTKFLLNIKDETNA